MQKLKSESQAEFLEMSEDHKDQEETVKILSSSLPKDISMLSK